MLKTIHNSLNMQISTLKVTHFDTINPSGSSLPKFTLKHSCYVTLQDVLWTVFVCFSNEKVKQRAFLNTPLVQVARFYPFPPVKE